MSILDKHPAPWKYASPQPYDMAVVDRAGATVLAGLFNPRTEVSGIAFATPEAKRLILAAPELLAALKETCAGYSSEWHDRSDGTGRKYPRELRAAEKLIARIEGGK